MQGGVGPFHWQLVQLAVALDQRRFAVEEKAVRNAFAALQHGAENCLQVFVGHFLDAISRAEIFRARRVVVLL